MAWSRLQSASNSVASGTTVSVTYGTNLTAGSTLIAVVTGNGVVTTSSVKDGAGNSFIQIASIIEDSNSEVSVWALNTPAGDVGTTPTITATPSFGTNTGYSILVQEIAGLVTSSTAAGFIDGTKGTSTSTSTGTIGPPSYTSAVTNEYLLYVYGDEGNGVTFTAPAAYTADPNNINTSSIGDIAIAYKNSTGGTETGTWSLSATTTWGLFLGAFKLPAATSGPPVLPQPGSRQWRARYRRKQAPWQPLGPPAAAGVPSPFFPPRILKGPPAAVKGKLSSSAGETGEPGVPAPFHAPRGLLRGAAAAVRGRLTGGQGRGGQPSPPIAAHALQHGQPAARPGKLTGIVAPPPVLHPVITSVFKLPGFPLRGRAAAQPGRLAGGRGQPGRPSPFTPPHVPLRGQPAARKGVLNGITAPPPVVQPSVPAPFFAPHFPLRGQRPVTARTMLTGKAAPPVPPPPPTLPRWQGATHMVAADATGNLIQGSNHTGAGGPGDLKGDFEQGGD